MIVFKLATSADFFCRMQTEKDMYEMLLDRKIAITPRMLGTGTLNIAGASHPFMVMQRLGACLSDTEGLTKAIFIRVRACTKCTA